ncbi:MAG: hydroxyisourate hydrolase [Synechococcales bacterium]|nr:hydroxyisourate hydrolase [Synechococcales bacterium]
MAGQLTTHVLDTVQGKPADGISITLWALSPDGHDRTILKQTTTNQDGRTDVPLLVDEALQVGSYELVFAVGEYFQKSSLALPQPYFLDQVPIRFGVADGNAHYHVPLLVSPWSYSTYRGS